MLNTLTPTFLLLLTIQSSFFVYHLTITLIRAPKMYAGFNVKLNLFESLNLALPVITSAASWLFMLSNLGVISIDFVDLVIKQTLLMMTSLMMIPITALAILTGVNQDLLDPIAQTIRDPNSTWYILVLMYPIIIQGASISLMRNYFKHIGSH